MRFKQRDATDCAAACVASVMAHYNQFISIATIRQHIFTDKSGTTVQGIVNGLTALGFQAKGVKGNPDSLLLIPLPAIAHVLINRTFSHFVVISSVSPRSVSVMDPADGRYHEIPMSEFTGMWSGVLIILQVGFETMKNKRYIPIVRRILQEIKTHRIKAAAIVFAAFTYTSLGMLLAIYTKDITDFGINKWTQDSINLTSLAMILTAIIQALIVIFKERLTMSMSRSIDANIILRYINHLLTLPRDFYTSMRVGEILSRVNDGVKIRAFISEAISTMTLNFFIVALSFCMMFSMYWKLAAVILLMIPIYAVLYGIATILNKKTERQIMEKSAVMESHLIEVISSVETIKAFQLESKTFSSIKTNFSKLQSISFTSGLHSIFVSSASELTTQTFRILVLWLGTLLVLQSRITLGEMLSFYTLTLYFSAPIVNLISFNKNIQNAKIAAERLYEITDLQSEPTDGRSMPLANTKISIDNISFGYQPWTNVIDGITFEISPGKTTAIVGESGSGKSTIAAILQKMYTPSAGRILFGETDIADLSSESLRRQISIVPQRIDLFDDSVLANIAVGDPAPDLEKVYAVCLQLGIMEFINRLPKGFDTFLGESGTTLSGGQRQRIAIARALYKDHEILLLDEPASALDSHAEKFVQDIITSENENGKTVILISHRLNSVKLAHHIVHLAEGKKLEEGTHQQLMQLKCRYYNLWHEQFPS